MPVPRRTGMAESFMSCQPGNRRPILLRTTSRVSTFSRLRMISAKPNMPIANTAKSTPSDSSAMPIVILSSPVSRSVPTVESNSPNTIIAMALTIEPRARTMAHTNPITINEKYSAGPNNSASFVRGNPNAAITIVATVPAKKEPMAATPKATPARPCLAIWWPSSVVTTDVASPGILTRMAVVEPPYCAP